MNDGHGAMPHLTPEGFMALLREHASCTVCADDEPVMIHLGDLRALVRHLDSLRCTQRHKVAF